MPAAACGTVWFPSSTAVCGAAWLPSSTATCGAACFPSSALAVRGIPVNNITNARRMLIAFLHFFIYLGSFPCLFLAYYSLLGSFPCLFLAYYSLSDDITPAVKYRTILLAQISLCCVVPDKAGQTLTNRCSTRYSSIFRLA